MPRTFQQTYSGTFHLTYEYEMDDDGNITGRLTDIDHDNTEDYNGIQEKIGEDWEYPEDFGYEDNMTDEMVDKFFEARWDADKKASGRD
jgi:hypothetical protein